nr:MAG: RNA-dependent RNA polymerase [Xiaogan mito-like virus 1]
MLTDQSTTMKNILIYTNKVVHWLLVGFIPTGTVPLSHLSDLIDRLIVLCKQRGEREALRYIKALRSDLIGYLSGNPIRSGLVSLTSDSIPKFFGDLIPHIRGKSYRVIAMICTILWCTRALSLGSPIDTSTITNPPKGQVANVFIFCSDFWKELGYRPAVKGTWIKKEGYETFRSKSGPNGHALSSSLADAHLISGNSRLMDSLKKVGGPKLPFLIKGLSHPIFREFLSSQKIPNLKLEGSSIRRISCFKDKEDKMRYIGILDWWSQLALKPLHRYLANTLAKIPQDCTLDQTKFIKLLKNSEVFYSVDLSSATDRFPIEGIFRVLSAQLPLDFVNAWRDLMVGYPFDFQKDSLNYSTGNPMGAYSSFNSFALAHHYIIYYCCRMCNVKWKTLPYALLGDDIVIGNKEVGEMYMTVIQSLGLDISIAKTHKSENFFEFAKRMFLDGVEITPFPISGLKACGQDSSMLTTLLWNTVQKGWIPLISLPSSVLLFFGIVKSLPFRVKKLKGKVSQYTEDVLGITQGQTNAEVLINRIIQEMSLPLPQLSNEICINILSNVVVAIFADSAIFNSIKDWIQSDAPLMNLAVMLTIKWESYWASKNITPRIPITIRDLPHAGAAKAVQTMYEDLELKLLQRDMTGSTWTLAMRTFALPRTDKSILDKGDYLIAKASLEIINQTKSQLQLLSQFPQLLDIRPLDKEKAQDGVISHGTWQIDDIRPC